MGEVIVPCKECLLIPICRHKCFLSVFIECSISRDYEPDYAIINKRNRERLIQVSEALNSTRWYVLREEYLGKDLVYVHQVIQDQEDFFGR